MSVSTKSPLSTVGGQLYSGAPRTGEFQHVRGGALSVSVQSGSLLTTAAFTTCAPGAVASGGHILFFSGAGRLNNVLPINTVQSGAPVFFYDAAALAASGTSVSGQRVLGVLPTPHQAYMVAGFQSGGGNPPWQWRYDMDTPYTSGLCAAIPSGCPGFTVNFTPEVIPPTPYGN